MDDLVQRLSEGNHPVIVGGPQPTLTEFKKRVEDMEYVFIKFTETRGGTDLGVRVDKTATRLNYTNVGAGLTPAREPNYTNVGAGLTPARDQATGSAHIEGTLTLNYVKVRCIADIDLATLQGTGHLVALEEVHP